MDIDEKANRDINREIEADCAFDEWFDRFGGSEEHRDMFRIVWMAAITWANNNP
jgi:hypothetical protein